MADYYNNGNGYQQNSGQQPMYNPPQYQPQTGMEPPPATCRRAARPPGAGDPAGHLRHPQFLPGKHLPGIDAAAPLPAHLRDRRHCHLDLGHSGGRKNSRRQNQHRCKRCLSEGLTQETTGIRDTMMNNEFENNPNPQNDIPQPTFTPAPDFEESAARAEEVAAQAEQVIADAEAGAAPSGKAEASDKAPEAAAGNGQQTPPQNPFPYDSVPQYGAPQYTNPDPNPYGGYDNGSYGAPQQPYGSSQYQQSYGTSYYQQYNVPPAGYAQKSRLAAGLLGIIFGSLGIHNFYLGFNTKAVVQLIVSLAGGLLTCGVATFAMWVWGFIEGILILSGNGPRQYDGNGVILRD